MYPGHTSKLPEPGFYGLPGHNRTPRDVLRQVQDAETLGFGNAKSCARRWLKEFGAGADGLIIHASTPEEFEPVLREYERMRPAHRFAGRSNRPA